MSFLDNSNKAVLWEVLKESTIFNGLNSSHFEIIKNLFENILINIDTNFQKHPLLEKNKIAVEILTEKINIEKNKLINERKKSNKLKIIYKADDLKKEGNDKLNSDYENQKRNFDSLINPIRPSEIVFLDKQPNLDDEPLGDNMQRLLDEKIAARNLDIEEIIPKKVSFEDGINVQTNMENNNIENIEFQKNELGKKENEKNNIKNLFKKLNKVEINSDSDLNKTDNGKYNDLNEKVNYLLNEVKEMKNNVNKIIYLLEQNNVKN
jgi:hypothetical protein